MRHMSIILQCSDGWKYLTLEDMSKYFINFGFLMACAIFNINDNFLYNQVEESRVLFFSKILCNKHAAPPILKFLKQSVSCGISLLVRPLGFYKYKCTNYLTDWIENPLSLLAHKDICRYLCYKCCILLLCLQFCISNEAQNMIWKSAALFMVLNA